MTSVAVIGAGVIGLSSAVFLQRRGIDVTVFDSQLPGGGASFGNAGMISVDACEPISVPGMLQKIPGWLRDPLGPLSVRPSYFMTALPWLIKWAAAGRMSQVERSSAALRSLHLPALDHYRELLGSVNFSDLIRVSGQIHSWEEEVGSRSEQICRRLWRQHGVVAESLDAEKLREMEPELSPSITQAVFLPKNGYTTNPLRLIQTLADLLLRSGGIIKREQVLRLAAEAGAFRMVTNMANHKAPKVVVAAGAWSQRLLSPLGIKLPLETERGYHVTIHDPNVRPQLPIVSHNRAFGMALMEAGLRVAGTVEIGGLDLPMNEQRAMILLRHAREMLPALRPDRFSTWMGFRSSFPDSLPVIGEITGIPGLFVAFGHGHTGMTAGASTGFLVSQLVGGERPVIDVGPFSPARF
jgi:glycine/D-amino acid oxidase-like deaminating enzyme